MFSYTRVISMRDVDAAGVVFFARYFELAHDAYEAFMTRQGVSFRSLVDNGDYLFPVVHAESDYKRPLELGEQSTVNLTVDSVGSRAFSIAYEILKSDGELACTVKTVHVAVSLDTRRAIPLPKTVREALKGGAQGGADAAAAGSGTAH